MFERMPANPRGVGRGICRCKESRVETVDKVQLVCAQCAAVNRLPAARLGDRPVCGRCKTAFFTGNPVELTAANFTAVVRGTEIPLLVDFWAPWCGPCRMMAPAYAQAAKVLQPRLQVAKLNTETARDIAARLRIQSVPTLALFYAGREIARRSGALDLRSLTHWVESRLGAIA
jgi:thioredoxin 2